MEKHWSYFLFMLWLTYLIVSSILLFSKGFLLSRVTQEQNSSCVRINQPLCNNSNDNAACYDIYENFHELPNICLPQKARIVLLIVDALRYDFTIYNRQLHDPLPYQNKLPIIDELQHEQPEFTRLYQFVADPPTTTMQRLKALTTGSLPTFIDAGSNFATPEINEDNLIDQILHNNRSTVFMGDDTWTGLFPNRFNRQFPYPSFNVWDLDTVDDGVRDHLFTELKNPDWSLLIGHFLGVDHCGHRYGPNHPEMSRKLTEINDVITNVSRLMDDNTVLLVIGDHGMTTNGDHGGESPDEINAAMFVYSKLPLFQFNESNRTRIVKQIGIVPTIATILGIPVPFSNLGTLIVDSVPMIGDNWRILLFSLWSNVEQMMNYIREYSKLDPDTFHVDGFEEKFQVLAIKLRTISTKIEFDSFYDECSEFLTSLRQNCEDVWIKFDSFSMTRGLLFLFLSVFFVYMITDGIPINRLPEIFNSSFLYCSYIIMVIAAVFSIILYYYEIVNNLISTIFFSTGLVSQFMLVMLVVQNWELISLSWYERSRKERFSNILTRLLLIFNLCSLFSNSFIMEESYMLLFLLNTVIIVGGLNIFQLNNKKRFDYKPKIKLILLALIVATFVRCSMLFWQCREEQQWCFEIFANFKLITSKTETTKLQWLLTVICLGLFVTFTKIWLRNCGNLNGYSLTVTLFKYIPTVLVVCISGYWVLNRLPVNTRNKMIKSWQINLLVWIVYFCTIFSVIVTIIKPLCIYIFNDKKNVATTEQNSIPQLFRRVKSLINQPQETEQIPVICGLGTVYSSIYIIVSVYLTLLIVLLQGDAVAPSSIIMYFTSCFIIVISSIIRLEKAETIDGLFEMPNIYILSWMILSHYFFYGTGHQPSFPNISWNAGFVGITDISVQLLPALLILIHTFASYILIGFLLPLLIIVPFTVAIMLPSFIKRTVLNDDSLRGEVVLYEKESLFITAIFTMCCKYIMCHAIRVFASMLAATILCRHLMVWNIFAPKFIFESIGIFITLFIVNFSYLLLIRVKYKMERLIVQLNRKYS